MRAPLAFVLVGLVLAGQHGVAHLFEHDIPYAGRFFTAENRALRARTSINGGAGTDYDFLRFYGDVMPDSATWIAETGLPPMAAWREP